MCILGHGLAYSRGGNNRCYKIFGILCRESSVEINTTFVHFGTVDVGSGFSNMQKLERTVFVYSVNLEDRYYPNTCDDYTYD